MLSPPALIVLHVDDDPFNRLTLGHILRHEGIAVTEASSGVEALKRAADQPDVILLDVQLPDINGLEVCRKLRANPATADIPIVQISGHFGSAEDRIQGLNAGADMYLTKPVEPGELLAHVKALGRTHRAEQALRQSEERCRLLVEEIKDYAIFMYDPEGRVLTWNTGAERLKGYRAAEIIGQPGSLFYTAEDIALGKPQQLLQTAASEGRVQEEGWCVRKDGSRFWASVVITALRDASGKLRGFGEVTHDLTERKQVEEKLRLVQFAFDNSAMPTSWIGPDGRFLAVNKAACLLMGYSAAELLTLRVQDIDPNFSDALWDARVNELRQRPLIVSETTAKRKDGTTVDLEIHTNHFVYQGHEYLFAFGLDISQRKQDEAQLHFQASLLDQVHNAVIATDLGGKVIYWNKFAETLYQWKREEALGNKIGHLIVPAESSNSSDPILELVRSRGYWEGEFSVRRKDGLVFPVHVIDVALHDSQGAPYGYVGVSEDISEHKRVTESLRDREMRLRLLLEQMPAIVWTTDRALRITSCYGAGLTRVRVADRAVVGMSLTEIFGADPKHPSVQAYHRALHGEGVAYVVDWGGRKWEAYLEPLRGPEGQTTGTLGVALDITDRKKAETEKEQLHQEVVASRELLQILSRRLIEAQEAERQHIARELHDEVGQVLTTVHLSLDALRPQVGQAKLADLEEALHVVERAIEQVRGLSFDLRPAALDLLGLETALRAYLKRQAARTGLRVDLDSTLGGERLPATAESACFRVVQEALTNTLRHAEATRFWVELGKSDRELFLTIRDDGKGFDVAAARQRMRKGRGFGLLSMQERVELFGGHIDVASAPGQGTTIRVAFPLPGASADPWREER